MDVYELFTRRVEKILPSKEGLESLMKKRKIRLYQGFDPTGSRLHLGHTIGLRLLMDFARLGHEATVLFGTGTVLVGDPSQREEKRKTITEEEIEKNIKTWRKQVNPIIDFGKVKVKENGDWLLPLTLKDIVKIASNISAVQLFKRDMFTRRIARGDTVWYHETMYPILQGYDSVVLDVDLEIGGTDQEFNMLIGRELQRKMNNKEKYVITVPMIYGIDGKPMSKSRGNAVWLDDSATDMFGKIMAIPDNQIEPYLRLVTNMPLAKVKSVAKLHPLQAKKTLAETVVAEFHGQKEAQKTREEFEEVFQEGKAPKSAMTFRAKSASINLLDVLPQAKLVKSKSEARRLLEQGGLEWNGQKLTTSTILVGEGGILKIGKHRFLKIKP